LSARNYSGLGLQYPNAVSQPMYQVTDALIHMACIMSNVLSCENVCQVQIAM